MEIKDFLPLILSKNASHLSIDDANTSADDFAKEMNFVSAAWSLSQKNACEQARRGHYQTPVEFIAAAIPKAFPIYVCREPECHANIGDLIGLRVTPEFFRAFPPSVRLGLIWGMGVAVTNQIYDTGSPSLANGAVTSQTFGQTPRGGRSTSDPSFHIARAFGKELADETKSSWDNYLKDNDLNLEGQAPV
jgi:hypothetical protein